MAVPSVVRKSTVTVWLLSPVRVTVSCTVSPSSADASAMDSVGVVPPPPSSSVMAPRPELSSRVAPSGLPSVTVKCSSDSCSSSSMVATEMVFVLSPGWKLSVPDAEV